MYGLGFMIYGLGLGLRVTWRFMGLRNYLYLAS